MTDIRTRFAPSPTGHLHIGGARTALFNWLLARGQGGKFILRVEDTDVKRSTDAYTQSILGAMEWLGLDWDEGPYFQTQRLMTYREHIDRLVAEGRAYWCHCEPDDLERRRQDALAQGLKPKYDGRCRELGLGPDERAVIRFKTPDVGATRWVDTIKGPISFENAELDDLIIQKSDGWPTYNFAVVIDDLTMNVTDVIRGDDHVNNTPRQIVIFQALGAPPPRFGHLPMILGADKTRLSKRHGATSVLAYKDQGYLPEALINYLVRLGWSHGDEEIFGLDYLVQKFSLNGVGKSAGVFNPDKLLWLNGHWMRESSPRRLADLATPFLQEKGLDVPDKEYLARAVETVQPRAKTLAELADGLTFYLADPEECEPKAAKALKPELQPALEKLRDELARLPEFDHQSLEDAFRRVAAETGVKLGALAGAVRAALTGRSQSPEILDVIGVLGAERVTRRLDRAAADLERS
jgi:glutamyl-tRNA synthetase